MSKDPVPEDVRQFILDHIDSVAELEGLLILRRSPESPWSADSLSREIYTSREQAEEVLSKLSARGFLEPAAEIPGVYIYRPRSVETPPVIDRVYETYKKYLVPVTNLIHSKPQTKVQQFADAFKLYRRNEK